MALALHNTLSKQKEPFESLKKGKVSMYTCGPTVYGRASIGNLSSYLFSDFLRRWLEVSGYDVLLVKNITDVGHLTQDDFDAGEDKMVAAAKREGKGVEEVARMYTDLYLQDEARLNLLEPEARPQASAYVKQQIKMVAKLLKKGHAYEVDGNVYYDVTSFPAYGALSGNKLNDLDAGARVNVDTNKKHPADFLLWRKAEPDHLMQWDSPWGPGYPGWHIECSAMALETLGKTIDIHTGGEDNIFPHHESEIAQSTAVTGKPLARFWLHRRHILVDGTKMSKSLGNVYSLDDLEEKGFHPLLFRFLVFSSHYRSKLDFSWGALEAAREGLGRILTFRSRLQEAAGNSEPSGDASPLASKAGEAIHAALDDDLNAPEALAALYDFVREGNVFLDGSDAVAAQAFAHDALDLLAWFDRVLGVLEEYPAGEDVDDAARLDIQTLIDEREVARAAKDFAKADEIRDRLDAQGIELNDKDGKTSWSVKRP